MKRALIGASAIFAAAIIGVVLLSGEKRAESAVVATEIGITGMSCQDCADKINTTLTKLDGVKAVEVHLGEGKAYVKYDAAAITVPAMEARITALGYSVGKAETAIDKKDGDDDATTDCCTSKKSSDKT